MRPRPIVAVAACLLSAITGAGMTVISAAPASARPSQVDNVRLNSFEATLLDDMNRVRRHHDLPALNVAPGTTDVARRWSWRLAKMQRLEHNPQLLHDLSHAGSPDWMEIEENVGYGPATDPDVLFSAYMNSPPHRANILGRNVRYVGVGVVERGDTAYNTVDFVDSYHASYGITRVPAGSVVGDVQQVDTTTVLATADHADERFGSSGSSGMHTSRPHFGRHAARVRFRGHRGSGALVFRQAVSLQNVKHLQVRVKAWNPRHRVIPVAIQLSDGWGRRTVRTVPVSRARTVTVRVPANQHGVLNTLSFRVAGRHLRPAGGKAALLVSDVRAIV